MSQYPRRTPRPTYTYRVFCNNCYCGGHIWKHCPHIECWNCRNFGHIRVNCPVLTPRRHGDGRHSAAKRVQWHREPRGSRGRAAPVNMNESCSSDIQETFPNLHSDAYRLYRSPSVSSCTSTMSSSSSEATPSPRTATPNPHQRAQVQGSNLRDDEAVNRVAEALFKFRKTENEPFVLLENKKLEDFKAKDNVGFLSLPQDDETLKRGDFDVLMINRKHGYILIEVKAVGDTLHALTGKESEQNALAKVLKRAAEQLEKNRRALGHLQPKSQRISIVSTLAFPNLSREKLRSALKANALLCERLAECISPRAAGAHKVPVESLCLCLDDLPDKNGIFDEANRDVVHSLSDWWSKLLQVAGPTQSIDAPIYEFTIKSFCRNEEIKTFSQGIWCTKREFQRPQFDDKQQELADSSEENVFITGPPGAGKSLVLAFKAASWISEGEKVFIIYKSGAITTQPAAEYLCHLIDIFLGREFPRSNMVHLRDEYKLDKFVDRLVKMNEADGNQTQTCRTTGDRSRLAQEMSFDELNRDTKYFETDENVVCHKRLNVIIDEIRMRVRTDGAVYDLLDAIKARDPHARIWCAGSFGSYCPRRDFQEKVLERSYRCTPKTQCILKACEPFCQGKTASGSNVFKYITSSTDVPNSRSDADDAQTIKDTGWKLPGDGFDPCFISHAEHAKSREEIWECPHCARSLVDNLQNDLAVGAAADSVAESDVLIAVTGPLAYETHTLKHSELYKQLTEAGNFKVNVLDASDNFDPQSPEITMMHVRNAAGIEKAVVVYVPCQHYRTRGNGECGQLAASRAAAGGQGAELKAQEYPPCRPSSQEQGQQAHLEAHDAETAREILDNYECLTVAQRENLSRLGHVNLHWLWYAASRSLAHLVVLHF